ncbi:endonuclease [Pedobacter sp. HMF7647]|uniref:Endonuclease n=1 Tax=Hufsiella arboris TaxID=2695275 RepID=A0A7K1YDW9_9SPHI|nr:endonuclease/exonuclease/phosphatase family protein [Hufsiella arboris]MXV52259.1 endonuclease [Hufsiella arboris]
MKSNSLLLAILFLFSCLICSAQNSIRVATYNLRYDNPADSGNLWKDRSKYVADLIRFHDFDLFGTQEGKKNQLSDLLKDLPEYSKYGKGRDDGKDGGEHSAIFYKKDKFKLLKSGDFWLSETPEKPSLGWDATCCNRVCSWAYFQDLKSGKKFYMFNVHFDHQGKVARVESAKLMIKRINSIAGNEPVVLTGDFNGDRKSEWYKILASSGIIHDSVKEVKNPYQNNSSYTDFGREFQNDEVIDHIFISSKFHASKWGILTDTYRGKFPSDHCPVLCVLQF